MKATLARGEPLLVGVQSVDEASSSKVGNAVVALQGKLAALGIESQIRTTQPAQSTAEGLTRRRTLTVDNNWLQAVRGRRAILVSAETLVRGTDHVLSLLQSTPVDRSHKPIVFAGLADVPKVGYRPIDARLELAELCLFDARFPEVRLPREHQDGGLLLGQLVSLFAPEAACWLLPRPTQEGLQQMPIDLAELDLCDCFAVPWTWILGELLEMLPRWPWKGADLGRIPRALSVHLEQFASLADETLQRLLLEPSLRWAAAWIRRFVFSEGQPAVPAQRRRALLEEAATLMRGHPRIIVEGEEISLSELRFLLRQYAQDLCTFTAKAPVRECQTIRALDNQ